jgi:hypothetical protein
MFGFLKLLAVVTPITVTDDVQFRKYDPQVVLLNRLLAYNHKNGTSDYDPGTEKAATVSSKPDHRGSWMSHMERTLTPAQFQMWQAEMNWRYDCWDTLDTVLNTSRYGVSKYQAKYALTRLQNLLGEDDFSAGWMPAPIPGYGDRVKWLQDSWEANKGSLDKLSPIALPDWIDLPSEFSLN